MSYTKFLEKLEDRNKLQEKIKEDSKLPEFLRTLTFASYDIAICYKSQTVLMARNSYNHILTLDDEDIEYFKNKAKSRLQKELEEEKLKIEEKNQRLNKL